MQDSYPTRATLVLLPPELLPLSCPFDVIISRAAVFSRRTLSLSLSLSLSRESRLDGRESFRRPALSRDRKFGLKIRISLVGRIKAKILSDPYSANALSPSRDFRQSIRLFCRRARVPPVLKKAGAARRTDDPNELADSQGGEIARLNNLLPASSPRPPARGIPWLRCANPPGCANHARNSRGHAPNYVHAPHGGVKRKTTLPRCARSNCWNPRGLERGPPRIATLGSPAE